MSRQQIDFPVQQHTITTPAPPPSGAMKLYPKTDNKFYQLDSAGVETVIGGGGGGGAGSDPLKNTYSIYADVDLRLNSNGYYTGTDWVRVNTVDPLGHLVVGKGTLAFWNAVAGTGNPSWVQRFGISTNGTVTLGPLSADTVSTPYMAWTSRIVSTVPMAGTIAGQAGGTGPFEIGTTGGGAAMIALHRHGVYALHFGLDTDNQVKIGGWSMGAVSYRILTTADGTPSDVAGASTIVKRTAAGYIYGNYINMTADVQPGAPVYVAGQQGDGFLRWYPKV